MISLENMDLIVIRLLVDWSQVQTKIVGYVQNYECSPADETRPPTNI